MARKKPPRSSNVKQNSRFGVEPLIPKDLHLIPLASRPGKVDVNAFAREWDPGEKFRGFIDSLPDLLAGRDIKEFLKRMRASRESGHPRIFAMGAHSIKVGLNPVLIDLMERGWISALTLNGAGVIHDFEIAFAGSTSEDVSAGLGEGRFGMAGETGEMLNRAVREGAAHGIGLGEAAAEMIHSAGFPHAESSLLAAAWRLRVPVTVHIAIGTDTIHFHPETDGAALGAASLRDFFMFCRLVQRLDGGGVFLNIGSAVLLPEVFLKAVTLLRNQGTALSNMTTAVFDFQHHYRPSENVAKRPVEGSGRGFYFIGHHEIMLPLLAAALKSF